MVKAYEPSLFESPNQTNLAGYLSPRFFKKAPDLTINTRGTFEVAV